MNFVNRHLNGWEIDPTLVPLSNETVSSQWIHELQSNGYWSAENPMVRMCSVLWVPLGLVGLFCQPPPPTTILRLLIHPSMLQCDTFLNTCSITKEPMLSFSKPMQTVHDASNCTVCCLKISGDGIVNGIVASYQKPLKEYNPHTEGNWAGGIQGAVPSISTIFF